MTKHPATYVAQQKHPLFANLRHADKDAMRYSSGMGRSIVITSGKGGVGKTTVLACLAIALSRAGKRVVCVDADITLNNLDMLLGLENGVVYDLYDVCMGSCRLRQALLRYPYCDSLYLLPSVHPLGEIDRTAFREVVSTLADNHDFVLIDCPAGIDDGFCRAACAANEALIVTTPTPTALRDADKVLGLLDAYKMNMVALVVNRVRGDLVLDGEMLSVEDIARILHVRVAGCIPEDDGALCMYGELPAEGGHYEAVRMLARYVLGAGKEVYDATAGYKGVVGKVRRLLKKV